MSASAQSRVVISGSGLWTPDHIITNDELVTAYNGWAKRYNDHHAQPSRQANGKPNRSAQWNSSKRPLASNSAMPTSRMGFWMWTACVRPFRNDRTRPLRPGRNGGPCCPRAMDAAGKTAADIDAVIVSCAYTQRAYTAIAIEVQDALNIGGFGFDILVACPAATFALHRAYEMASAGTARCVLSINPELTSPQVTIIVTETATSFFVTWLCDSRGACRYVHWAASL